MNNYQKIEFERKEPALACNLTQAEFDMRRQEVSAVFSQCLSSKELADGYAFSFPGSDEWAATLLQLIVFERKCCLFFTYELVFEPDMGLIWLHLRGSEGVKDIIRQFTFL